MTLHAGKLDPSTHQLTPLNSMAHTIERALAELAPPGKNEDLMWRRKLVLAIARGVLEHLHNNAGSLHVKVPNTGSGVGTHQQAVTIDIDLGT